MDTRSGLRSAHIIRTAVRSRRHQQGEARTRATKGVISSGYALAPAENSIRARTSARHYPPRNYDVTPTGGKSVPVPLHRAILLGYEASIRPSTHDIRYIHAVDVDDATRDELSAFLSHLCISARGEIDIELPVRICRILAPFVPSDFAAPMILSGLICNKCKKLVAFRCKHSGEEIVEIVGNFH